MCACDVYILFALQCMDKYVYIYIDKYIDIYIYTYSCSQDSQDATQGASLITHGP